MATASGREEIEALGREYSSLRDLVAQIDVYRALQRDLAEAEDMLEDDEMRVFAQEEIQTIKEQIPQLQKDLQLALLPKDEADDRSVIMELRAGTGGDEAALFVADLLRMYQRYADIRGYKFEVVEESPTELGGYKELTAHIIGDGAFARMKFESGVHRVQRVPSTESGGRVHTSAATVAIMPEAETVDIEIDPADIRLDTMRASGAGGQHVNTTDSAVRITHIPTGVVVTSSEKSQHRNREIAMQVLRTRLYDLKRQEAEQERSASRKTQVGSGDRSERIRTYNFPQGRISDHRINLTLYKLEAMLQGQLDEMIDALISFDQAAKLADLEV